MGEFNTMAWDASHELLVTGPLPALRLAVIVAVTAGFFGLATLITSNQEF